MLPPPLPSLLPPKLISPSASQALPLLSITHNHWITNHCLHMTTICLTANPCPPLGLLADTNPLLLATTHPHPSLSINNYPHCHHYHHFPPPIDIVVGDQLTFNKHLGLVWLEGLKIEMIENEEKKVREQKKFSFLSYVFDSENGEVEK